MQWFFIEVILLSTVALAYYSLVKHRIFLSSRGFYALNSRRIVFLGFLLVVLHIAASSALLINSLSLHLPFFGFDLTFHLQYFLSSISNYDQKATGAYAVSFYPLIFALYLVLVYFISASGIFAIKQQKLVLPLQGWFKPFSLFVAAIYFGFFLVFFKIYNLLESWQLIIFTFFATLLMVASCYAFFYARRFFLKLNIETSFILSFVIGLGWILFLV